MQNRLGRQTLSLARPPVILSHAAVGGRQEGEGPLAHCFDCLSDDSFFGEKTWEKAESAMQKTALSKALEDGAELTDDCAAVERLGIGVALTQGEYRNLKITTPEDMAAAEALLAQWDEA